MASLQVCGWGSVRRKVPKNRSPPTPVSLHPHLSALRASFLCFCFSFFFCAGVNLSPAPFGPPLPTSPLPGVAIPAGSCRTDIPLLGVEVGVLGCGRGLRSAPELPPYRSRRIPVSRSWALCGCGVEARQSRRLAPKHCVGPGNAECGSQLQSSTAPVDGIRTCFDGTECHCCSTAIELYICTPRTGLREPEGLCSPCMIPGPRAGSSVQEAGGLRLVPLAP